MISNLCAESTVRGTGYERWAVQSQRVTVTCLHGDISFGGGGTIGNKCRAGLLSPRGNTKEFAGVSVQ